MTNDDFSVYAPDGKEIGHVVPHPRMEGYWMAVWKPRADRDCGMKRYKTRAGATKRVLAEWSTVS